MSFVCDTGKLEHYNLVPRAGSCLRRLSLQNGEGQFYRKSPGDEVGNSPLCHKSQNISAFRFKNTELRFVSFIWSLLISLGHKIVIFQMRALHFF